MAGLLTLFCVAMTALTAILVGVLVWEMRHPPRHTSGWAIAKGLACDPAELGLAFEQWPLELPDGAVLPVWAIQQATTAGAADRADLTVVFIHGWGHSRIDALQRVQPFLAHVDRLVLYDLRGHGDSERCASRLGRGESDDLLALLERLGPGPCLLVGHSMGAVIAITAAAAQSTDARVVGVIAYGPYMEFHRSLIGRLRMHGFPTRPFTDLAMLVLRACGIKPLSLDEQSVRRCACPLLIIHGAADQVSPISHARRLAAVAPDAWLEEVDGAGHVDAHVVAGARHDELVRGFVERVRGCSEATGH